MSKTVTINYDKKREYEFYEILKNSFKNVSINEQINRFYLEVTRQIKNKENEFEHEFICKKSYYNLTQYPYLKSLIVVKDILIGVVILNDKEEPITVYYKEHKPIHKIETVNHIEIDYISLSYRRIKQ